MSVGVRAAILALSFLLAGCIGPEGTEILGTENRNPPDAPDLTLENQIGEDVTLSDYDGTDEDVAIIYTACPDVCLIISSNIDYVSQNLGSESESVEFISITIDPARDTTQRLLEWTLREGTNGTTLPTTGALLCKQCGTNGRSWWMPITLRTAFRRKRRC